MKSSTGVKRAMILLAIGLVIAVIYLKPIPHRTFTDFYPQNDAIRSSLEQFRQLPTKKIHIQGREWTYLSTGTGTRNLVFLHGMGGAYDIWWQQINALKEDFHILSITLPDVHSLEDALQGINTILDAEGIRQTSILGTSMGGYIAQYMLWKEPERLTKVILGNTFPPNDYYRSQNQNLRKILPFIPAWLVMKVFRDKLSEGVLPAAHDNLLVEAYLKEQYSGIMTKKQFIGRLDIVLESFNPDWTEKLPGIPILIIEADNDPLVTPELQDGLHALYPQASYIRLHDVGHFPYLNDPVPYTSFVQHFLNQ